MPIDPTRRTSDRERALILMVERQADEQRTSVAPSDPAFAALIPTTWRELVDAALIEERGEKPGPTYRLTPSGWLTGLQLSGAYSRQDVRERAITIRRALQARIKGRRDHHDALVDVREFASEVRLPVGWVWNAIRANLLQAMFPNDLMNAFLDVRHGLMIHIPPTFDMDRTG
ncbi:MAG: hypothetical protein ACRD1V_02370 [Vicinamibacterales bacterium]